MRSVVLCIILIVNLVYYQAFWREFRNDTPTVEARYEEVTAAEMSMEQVYQNVLAGKNPFALRSDEFYPFGTSFTTTDPGNGLYFVFLRPFLSTHQSMLAISMISLMLASLGMYLLLRLLKIGRALALILGLAFAYTTFLMPRAGHLTYFSTYVFPWFFACSYQVLHDKRVISRFGSAVGAAFFLVMALYHNSYYFVTLGIAVASLIGYYLIYRRRILWRYIKTGYREFTVFGMTTLILLAPWIYQVRQDRLFDGLPTTRGWGGAIEYSSDIFGYFIPSHYSRFLGFISKWTEKHFVFARGIFENYSYPGILFLTTFGILGYLWWRKRISTKLRRIIAPLLFATFWIWILTLGPFLHVAGRWTIGLQEGIKLVIPLPFVIFHYLPFMANIRSPGRLSIGFIFVGYIVVAYIWQWLWVRMNSRKQKIFLVILTAILIIDHTLVYTPARLRNLPTAYYQVIKADPSFGTVMEIPSTIRDGFIYFGNGDELDFIAGQMIHRKPIVNGYIGRLSAYKMRYAQNNPFLGYVGRLIDPNVLNNGGLDRTSLQSWDSIDIAQSKDAVDLLDLSYIILKNETNYSATMAGVLQNLGFEKLQDDIPTSLWHRQPSQREFLHVDIGERGDDFMLAGEWYGRDQGFRWFKSSGQVLFKIQQPRTMKLVLSGASYQKPQEASIYMNRKKIGIIQLQTEEHIFELEIPREDFSTGINILHIIAEQGYAAGENVLSAKFSFAELSN